jgi:hypothetical protein
VTGPLSIFNVLTYILRQSMCIVPLEFFFLIYGKCTFYWNIHCNIFLKSIFLSDMEKLCHATFQSWSSQSCFDLNEALSIVSTLILVPLDCKYILLEYACNKLIFKNQE